MTHLRWFSLKGKFELCIAFTFTFLSSLTMLQLLWVGQTNAMPPINEYPVTSGQTDPTHITTGSDGALWYTEQGTDQIGRTTTSGTVTDYSIVPSGATSATVSDITTGPDGNLTYGSRPVFQLVLAAIVLSVR